jgi:hypothetical protein
LTGITVGVHQFNKRKEQLAEAEAKAKSEELK